MNASQKVMRQPRRWTLNYFVKGCIEYESGVWSLRSVSTNFCRKPIIVFENLVDMVNLFLLVQRHQVIVKFAVRSNAHACGGDSAANSSGVERRLLSTTPSVPAQQHRESRMTGSLEARGLSSSRRSWERSSDLTNFHARQGCASATVLSCVFVCSLPGVYSPRAPSCHLM